MFNSKLLECGRPHQFSWDVVPHFVKIVTVNILQGCWCFVTNRYWIAVTTTTLNTFIGHSLKTSKHKSVLGKRQYCIACVWLCKNRGIGRCFGIGWLQGHFLWFKSVHVRNHLVRLSPKIMGGSSPHSPLPTPLKKVQVTRLKTWLMYFCCYEIYIHKCYDNIECLF